MHQLVNGVWRPARFAPATQGGEFVRPESQFRRWITADGRSGFPAEAGRYHLYVSLACPWAHRTLIFRKLKGLDDAVSVSVVHPHMGDEGWVFGECEGCTPDTVNGCRRLYEVYTLADPSYTGLVTTPTLWDKERRTIVNNESADIIRMLNGEFDAYAAHDADFYPPALREEIDEINAYVYDNVNDGVYRAGFADSQAAYEQAFDDVFRALTTLEARLAEQRYLVGGRLTEADLRLFPTLVRFDAVYYSHFKCNLRRLIDCENLWSYTREIYQMPGVAETVNLDHIKRHYYTSHPGLNPSGIVPKGPMLDFARPHDRDRLRRSGPRVGGSRGAAV
ncbi:MAG: glutathione S-transferase family protein [Gammaproteobacteria bacterium]|nr:glutathione S-transferase family protein [Gammaproteobacteria bacterium]NIR83752.1 glutathione S-transferase family protein [Gammaproteobacteria bacterium]NIU05058.1 glutathione S-transferase family protein [Gammaproteobacteria bacterium]NIX86331.1 glutathione S-transferase family protein [Gammaproteobacteria bacterium]